MRSNFAGFPKLQQRGDEALANATPTGGRPFVPRECVCATALCLLAISKVWFPVLTGEHSVEIPFREIRESSHGEDTHRSNTNDA